jgi:hypothetical protein
MEAIMERYQSMSHEDRVRSRNLAMSYDIRIEDYNRMLAEQNGLCAICGKPPSGKRNSRTIHLAVDHDHISGHVRKLLCSHCNAGIGGFKDSVELLRAAIAYIESHCVTDAHEIIS